MALDKGVRTQLGTGYTRTQLGTGYTRTQLGTGGYHWIHEDTARHWRLSLETRGHS